MQPCRERPHLRRSSVVQPSMIDAIREIALSRAFEPVRVMAESTVHLCGCEGGGRIGDRKNLGLHATLILHHVCGGWLVTGWAGRARSAMQRRAAGRTGDALANSLSCTGSPRDTPTMFETPQRRPSHMSYDRRYARNNSTHRGREAIKSIYHRFMTIFFNLWRFFVTIFYKDLSAVFINFFCMGCGRRRERNDSTHRGREMMSSICYYSMRIVFYFTEIKKNLFSFFIPFFKDFIISFC